MFAPVPVIVITLAVPTALNVIFPFAVAILTLLLPLLILDMPLPAVCATQLKLPEPSVCNTYAFVPPDICRFATAPNVTLDVFAKFTIPLLVNPVNVPTLVKLLVTTDALRVVPVKLAALAVITVLAAAVN